MQRTRQGRYGAFIILAVLALVPRHAWAQNANPDDARSAGPQRAANFFLGAHGLGIGVEIPVADRIQLAVRAQGFVAERTILAGGLRVDLVRADHAALYGAGLLGRAGCGTTLFDASCNIDGQNGAAAIAGFEISVSGGDRVLLGTEAGYWFTVAGEDASLAHPTLELILRVREH